MLRGYSLASPLQTAWLRDRGKTRLGMWEGGQEKTSWRRTNRSKRTWEEGCSGKRCWSCQSTIRCAVFLVCSYPAPSGCVLPWADRGRCSETASDKEALTVGRQDFSEAASIATRGNGRSSWKTLVAKQRMTAWEAAPALRGMRRLRVLPIVPPSWMKRGPWGPRSAPCLFSLCITLALSPAGRLLH